MSEYLNKIANISPKQRFAMMDLGLNPLNPDHIKKYMSGDRKINVQENIEYIKSIIPAHELNKDLGHGKHKDMDPIAGQEYNGSNYNPQSENNTVNIRKNLMQEMDESVENVQRNINRNTTNKLMSLTQNEPRMQQNQQGQSDKLLEALKVGKERATNFHNAYIKCLKQPSSQAYMEIYKSLKLMLEQEQKLTNSQLLPNYKKGINEVTQQMYNKIMKLND